MSTPQLDWFLQLLPLAEPRVPSRNTAAEAPARRAPGTSVYALKSKLQDIFAEGLEARYARHRRTNQMTRDRAAKLGFNLFLEKGFESLTLTCVSNGARAGGRVVDVPKLRKLVKDQGFLIDGGYGKIKGATFRISNMGDETEATMGQLVAAMDAAMGQL